MRKKRFSAVVPLTGQKSGEGGSLPESVKIRSRLGGGA